ncbi:Atxe2 family lasso peptide isopeptidase [Paremcibacter congregatus]|uniref:Peptidase S9 prolyl oligopeptidase catalytic domain-containing protein n=1 Tax=Paremcibacter congregatus TaxID=2043170 RepID=A0A2G4YMK6_9PROT|nr:Atxe2 family lasso peptide isopeptidase [Paremcibacter congregatus]PHZ83569.1 hypothetical protein CRD36_16520 [Paremcibacter congregatus]QDE28345.1 Atxe2 family lasso peptide isopeptidase [Paremcibacter congregatus]
MLPFISPRLSSLAFFLRLLFLATTGIITAVQAAPKRDITVRDLVEFRDVQTIRLSPNGQYVAFQTLQRHADSNDFTVAWYIVATQPGAAPHIVDTGTEPVRDDRIGQFFPSAIVWAPDNDWVYFTKKHQGTIQIWRSSLNAAKAEQISHQAGDVMSPRLSPDGAKLFYTMGRSHAELAALKKTLARDGYLQQNPALYYLEHGPMIPFCTDGRARISLGSDKLSCRLKNFVYDIASGTTRNATQDDLKLLGDQDDDFSTMMRQGPLKGADLKFRTKMSPDGSARAWAENVDPEIYKGLRPPVVLTVRHNGDTIRCAAPQCRGIQGTGFQDLWWSPNGKEIIFKVVDGPHHSLISFYGWTPETRKIRQIHSSNDIFSQCELTGLRLICGHQTWTSPTKIVALNSVTGGITPIASVNPEFDDIRFTKVEKILGKDAYGHEVYGHLIYPKGYQKGKKYPLVVTQYHSYGFLRGATGHEQPLHVYARDGVAVLSFDHRQNFDKEQQKAPFPDSNINHEKKIYIEQRPATAVENMIDDLVARGIADPDRIGVTGFSYGDVVLDTLLMRRNYAAASSTGLSSIPPYRKFPPGAGPGKRLDHAFGKPFTPEGHTKRLKYSLAAQADKIDTPILMQTADREFYFMSDTYYALLDAGKPVELYQYPDEYHVKWQPAHNERIYSRNLDWFKFWLRGAEDGDPAKAAQYERWRTLRERHKINMQTKK